MKRHTLRAALVAWASIASFAVAGCGGDEGVVRVIDGDVLVQRVTPAESYAAFLAGTIAEADGKFELAAARYKDAISVDDRDPLLWAKYGEVTCRIAPSSNVADEAFRRANELDPSFSTLAEARSSCEARRSHGADATSFALLAAAEDPLRPSFDARANELVSVDAEDAARARTLAATRVFADRPEAWEALATFGLAHHDSYLAAVAAETLLDVRANHFNTGARVAIALASFGELDFARRVAKKTVQKKSDGRAVDSFVAHLAVDAAIAEGDRAGVEAVATAARVSLGEAAARAWIVGKNEVARVLAEEVQKADPEDADAAIVLAALHRDRHVRTKRGVEISSAAFLVFAEVLLAREGADAARAFASTAMHAAIDGRDALLLESSVALCAAGIGTPESDSARVELALRLGDAPKILPALDERHELAARLLADGTQDAAGDARKIRLKMALSREVGRDALITYAVVESARRAGAVAEKDRAAIFRVPPSALVLSLRIALADGAARDDDKKRLRAIAVTAKERSLAGM